ncbi:hypothetical protein [Desulfarculus baarsii]
MGKMRQDVVDYADGLLPELDETMLAPETISRRAYRRQELHEVWHVLTAEERALVAQADLALIAAADMVAVYWRTDDIKRNREKYQPPKEAWWWWLHEIAEGAFPAELLPKAARP